MCLMTLMKLFLSCLLLLCLMMFMMLWILWLLLVSLLSLVRLLLPLFNESNLSLVNESNKNDESTPIQSNSDGRNKNDELLLSHVVRKLEGSGSGKVNLLDHFEVHENSFAKLVISVNDDEYNFEDKQFADVVGPMSPLHEMIEDKEEEERNVESRDKGWGPYMKKMKRLKIMKKKKYWPSSDAHKERHNFHQRWQEFRMDVSLEKGGWYLEYSEETEAVVGKKNTNLKGDHDLKSTCLSKSIKMSPSNQIGLSDTGGPEMPFISTSALTKSFEMVSLAIT